VYVQVVISVLLLLAAPSSGGADWYDTWRSFDVDPLVAESVVWPEMERSDYSIGIFQMKPSFIEDLEKAWMRSGLARRYELWFDTADNATARRIRISRLQKEEWQVIYLGVFLRLLYHAYGSYDRNGEKKQEGLETLPLKEQVRLAATAYNRGCAWPTAGYGDLDTLREHAREKHFHYALVPVRGTKRYCYGDLAVRHYRLLVRHL